MQSGDIIESVNKPTPRVSMRFWTLYLWLILVAALLASRGFYLQIIKGNDFLAVAENNRITKVPITAPRGIIYDVNGIQLTDNIASTHVILDPTSLPPAEYEGMLVERLHDLLQIDSQEVQEDLMKARDSMRPVKVGTALDHDTVLALERAHEDIPGVQLVSTLVRRYAKGSMTSVPIGYAGQVSDDELLNNDYLVSTDIVGKTGLEKKYDELLHGQHGIKYIEVDSSGITRKDVREEEPTPGADLHLTLDEAMQERVMNVLEEADQELSKAGEPPLKASVVALDPRSGAIRALVSYPSYDSNIFSQPRLTDQVDNIMSDQRQPLFNRAVEGTYPPGSTIKPFIAVGALNDGIITPQTTFVSTGGLTVGVWHFPDWKAGGHGVTDIKKAIAQSVNTFFYIITGGYEGQAGLGLERTDFYLKSFGWGEKTGIDLPQEAKGFLPTAEWKLRVKGEPWYIGDTYHLGIGQGDVLVSPLQVAVATGAIANGGTVQVPSLVRSISIKGIEQSIASETGHKVGVAKQNLEVVRDAMRETILSGSGKALSSLPIALAGKTGTAQVGEDSTHAWFTSFAPYEDPKLVVTVLMERAGGGDEVAIPVAKKVWEWWISERSQEL